MLKEELIKELSNQRLLRDKGQLVVDPEITIGKSFTEMLSERHPNGDKHCETRSEFFLLLMRNGNHYFVDEAIRWHARFDRFK